MRRRDTMRHNSPFDNPWNTLKMKYQLWNCCCQCYWSFALFGFIVYIIDSQQNKSIIHSFHPIKFDWWYNILVSQKLSFDSNLVNREAQIPNNVTKGKIDCHFWPIRLEYLRENDQLEAWYMGVVTCRECVTRKAWGGFLRSIKTWGRCFIC